MEYGAFLTRIIEDGLVACRKSYADRPNKLEGSIAGFEACRGKQPMELAILLQEARRNMALALVDGTSIDDYWRKRCYYAEIEWVCNVVSAALQNEGKSIIVPVTARGVIKAAEIIGVAKVGGLPN